MNIKMTDFSEIEKLDVHAQNKDDDEIFPEDNDEEIAQIIDSAPKKRGRPRKVIGEPVTEREKEDERAKEDQKVKAAVPAEEQEGAPVIRDGETGPEQAGTEQEVSPEAHLMAFLQDLEARVTRIESMLFRMK